MPVPARKLADVLARLMTPAFEALSRRREQGQRGAELGKAPRAEGAARKGADL